MIDTAPKCALVTGAAHRIGRAIAHYLAAEGWAVAAHYNQSEDAAASLVDEIAAAGGTAVAIKADLADEAATAALLADAGAAMGPVECLVNNASIFEDDRVESATRDSWDRHMAINLRAPFVLIQAMARQLPEERAGNVVNLLDERVWNPTPFYLSYTLSKSGLWLLTQTLALALAPKVRVNAIGPGPTLAAANQSEEHFHAQYRATPLGRGTTPDEVCAALRFILAAPALTGQMIALDGGRHLGWNYPGKPAGPGADTPGPSTNEPPGRPPGMPPGMPTGRNIS